MIAETSSDYKRGWDAAKVFWGIGGVEPNGCAGPGANTYRDVDPCSYGAETVVETSPEYKQRALDALLEIAEDLRVKPSDRIKAATDLFFAAPK